MKEIRVLTRSHDLHHICQINEQYLLDFFHDAQSTSGSIKYCSFVMLCCSVPQLHLQYIALSLSIIKISTLVNSCLICRYGPERRGSSCSDCSHKKCWKTREDNSHCRWEYFCQYVRDDSFHHLSPENDDYNYVPPTDLSHLVLLVFLIALSILVH